MRTLVSSVRKPTHRPWLPAALVLGAALLIFAAPPSALADEPEATAEVATTTPWLDWLRQRTPEAQPPGEPAPEVLERWRSLARTIGLELPEPPPATAREDARSGLFGWLERFDALLDQRSAPRDDKT